MTEEEKLKIERRMHSVFRSQGRSKGESIYHQFSTGIPEIGFYKPKFSWVEGRVPRANFSKSPD